MVLILALVSCGHYKRNLNESHVNQEATSFQETVTAESHVATAASTTTAKKGKARTRWYRPDGTLRKERDESTELDQASQSASDATASASRSAAHVGVKASSSTVVLKEEGDTSPWWWAWWFPALLVIGLLAAGLWLRKRLRP